jgi:hypothetical protein
MGRKTEFYGGWYEDPNNWKKFRHLPTHRTARDLVGSTTLEGHTTDSGIYDSLKGDDRKLLDAKYEEAKNPEYGQTWMSGQTLRDYTVNNGIKIPIEIHVDKETGEHTLTDGHHRLAIALKHFPDTPIPIKYHG